MATLRSKLLDKQEIAEGTMQFTLEKPAELSYRAGQFFDIVLLDDSIQDVHAKKHGFSFVSAPYEATIAAATRMRAGSAFKNNIRKVFDGAAVDIIAPFGDFTLHKTASKPAVFVIGGIGITPVYSMIKQATRDKSAHKLTLLYANRTRAQAAYTKELEALAKSNPNFNFIPVYTQEKVDGAEHGIVDEAMLKRHVPDMDSPRFYLSGPEGMVKAMRTLLVETGANEDNIRTEEFEGY